MRDARPALRFMKSPAAPLSMHWEHEPETRRTVPPTRCCRRLVGRASLRFLCRQDAGSTLGFMESPLSFFRIYSDQEPVDCAVASWTAPVLWRFWSARLHRQSARRLAHSKTCRGLPQYMESPRRVRASIGTLNRFESPSPVLRTSSPPSGGEGWGEGVRFIESPRG